MMSRFQTLLSVSTRASKAWLLCAELACDEEGIAMAGGFAACLIAFLAPLTGDSVGQTMGVGPSTTVTRWQGLPLVHFSAHFETFLLTETLREPSVYHKRCLR